MDIDELHVNVEGVEYLTFEPKDNNIIATYGDSITKTLILVTREVWTCIINSIKTQASGVFLIHVVGVLKDLLFMLMEFYKFFYCTLHGELDFDLPYVL